MPSHTGLDSERLQDLKRMLCYQLSPLSCPSISTMSPESPFLQNHEHLCSIIHRTVTLGESNSVMIIGPRGSGKTALLRTVIDTVNSDPKLKDNLLTVQLNGLLHTDDRLALKDFAFQLKMNIVFDDDDDDEVKGTFEDIFAQIIETLREERKAGCSIMVTLEEFDLFCSHKNQTLLYNLVDISQAGQTPIVVIGLTSRFDVIGLLEKRVKSRFSLQQIHLFHPKSFEDNLKTVSSLLTVPKPDYGWNKHVAQLLKDKNVCSVLRNWFSANLNYHDLKRTLLVALMGLNKEHPFLTHDDIERAFSLKMVDGKTSILSGLSALELTLVICILNYLHRTQEEKFNFHVIYLEYQTVAVKKHGMQDVPPVVVEKAYQRLEQVEVMQAAESRSGHQTEYRPMRLLVDRAQVRECLEMFQDIPTALKQLASVTIHESR